MPLRYDSPDVKAPLKSVLAAIAALAVALLLAACGGGDDDDEFVPGDLTDPGSVPTATPWQSPPEVVIIDPNNLTPLPPTQPNAGTPDTGETPTPATGEPGVCGDTYTVAAGDTTFGIAEKCGTTPEEIEALNPDIDIRSLTIGQVLIMPTSSAEEEQ
jgi:LysM repeat protein